MDPVWIGAGVAVSVSVVHGAVRLVRQQLRKNVEMARIAEQGRTERVRRVARCASLEESSANGHSLRVVPLPAPSTGGEGACGRR